MDTTNNTTVEVECLDVDQDSPDQAMARLQDWDGIVAMVPTGVWLDNHLPVPAPGVTRISTAMHEAWFGPEHRRQRQEMSQRIRAGFKSIMASRHVFDEDPQLLNVSPDWFRSGTTLTGSFGYSFGALFEAWSTGDMSTPDGGLLVSVSGSPLSGAHTYLAWGPGDELRTGRELPGWGQKLIHLRGIASNVRTVDATPLSGMRRLLEKVGIG
jgi:hypothetical protein